MLFSITKSFSEVVVIPEEIEPPIIEPTWGGACNCPRIDSG